MSIATPEPQQSVPSHARPSIAVIVVTYNTRELLQSCLASLRATALPLQTIVVDNGSSDGSAEMVTRQFPEVDFLSSKSNLGFAAANNWALRRLGLGDEPAAVESTPDYILLLNPDAQLLSGALETLVSFMQAHPRVAVVAPQLRYPDGTHQPGAFRFPTLLMSFLDLFPPRGPFLGRLYFSPLNGRCPQDGGSEPFPIDHPLGAAMLVRPAAIRQVGLLDERYWMYAEEVDWCYRLRRAGWAIWQVPSAQVVHVGGASARQFRAHTFLALHRSRLRFFLRFYSAHFVRWHCRILYAAALRDLLASSVALLRGRRDETLNVRMLAASELLRMAGEARRELALRRRSSH